MKILFWQINRMKNILDFFKGVNPIYPFVVIFILVVSCKKEDKLGLSVQPDDGQIGFASSDSFQLGIKHILPDSLLSSNRSSVLLGSYVDPEFGLTKSTFITQLRLSSNSLTFDNIVVDSAVLSLRLDNAYGKAGLDTFNLTPQTFRVYELADAIDRDSSYYHNDNFNWGTTVIGEAVDVQPNFGDSIDAPEGKEPPQFLIRMDQTWAQNLLTQDASIFNSNDDFLNHLKGIAIVPENNQSIGEGEVLYLNPVSIYSRMTFYYHEVGGDTTSVEFLINDSCARISHFEHDYNGTSAGTALMNATDSPEMIYLQAMGGTWADLEFTDLFERFKDENVIINLAELRLSVVENSDDYPTIATMNLLKYNKDGEEEFLPDANAFLDGTYDSENKEYVFKISRYVEQLLADYKNGEDNNFGLVILPTNNGISGNRTIIYGPGHTGENKLKLKIYYTPIN